MRYLLAFFFLHMYAGDNLGLNLSFGLGLSLKNLLLYLLFAGIALNSAVARNRSLQFPSVLFPFVLLILYALITWVTISFVIQDPEYQMRTAFISLKSSLGDQFLTYVVFFFGVLTLKDAFWLLRAIIWIAVIGNIVTLMDGFDTPNLDLVEARMSDDRFLGFIGSANGYGQFLVLFLPPAIALYLTQRGKARLLAGIGVLATALALVMTGSRGAYVGLLAGGIVGAVYLRRFVPLERVMQGAVVAVGLGFVVVLISLVLGYSDVYMEQLGRFGGSSHVATSGRSTIWANAIAEMLRFPLSFVTGYGFYAYESGRFYAAAHNMYLNYLYDLGIIGLSLYVIVFARIVMIVRSRVAMAPTEIRPFLLALGFGLLGFLASIFFSGYTTSAYLIWGYLGVIMRIAAEIQEREAPAAAVERAAPPQALEERPMAYTTRAERNG